MDPILKECSLYLGDCQALCLKTLASCLRRRGKFADAALCVLLASCAEACFLAWRACLDGRPDRKRLEDCAAACDKTARCCDRLAWGDAALSVTARALRACGERCAELAAAAQSPAPAA